MVVPWVGVAWKRCVMVCAVLNDWFGLGLGLSGNIYVEGGLVDGNIGERESERCLVGESV